MFSKPVPAPEPVTVPDAPEARFNAASALHESALAVYHDIADRLTEATARYSSLIDDLDGEIERLVFMRNEAANRANQADESARSILDLTRGFRND